MTLMSAIERLRTMPPGGVEPGPGRKTGEASLWVKVEAVAVCLPRSLLLDLVFM